VRSAVDFELYKHDRRMLDRDSPHLVAVLIPLFT
jgi:hypothetical protein